MPETPAERREANQRVPGKGNLSKYKWWLIGGLAVVAIVVFIIIRKQSSSSSGTSSLAAMGIDPATGVPYSQEYANAFGMGMGIPGGGWGGGGMTGPRGGTGPPGKTGPRGPKGGNGHHKRHNGHKKKGSRTEAMTAALAARRQWNSRIAPFPIKRQHYV